MEETIQKQISRIQALTDDQKERFLKIYFHGSSHSTIDNAVLAADPE